MAKEEDEEAFRARLNAKLPKDIKVFCVVRSSNRFNAKICTSNREYSYYLPSFMMTKITDLYFGTGKAVRRENIPKDQPAANGASEEEEKKPIVSGIKIMKPSAQDEDNDDNYKQYENQEAYIHRNIDHIPQEKID
jgi:tRNA U38,U39,U40 pseudouridine synthase TruA